MLFLVTICKKRPISQTNNTFLININVCIYIQIYERDDRTGVYTLKPNTELGEPLYLVFSPPPIKNQIKSSNGLRLISNIPYKIKSVVFVLYHKLILMSNLGYTLLHHKTKPLLFLFSSHFCI